MSASSVADWELMLDAAWIASSTSASATRVPHIFEWHVFESPCGHAVGNGARHYIWGLSPVAITEEAGDNL